MSQISVIVPVYKVEQYICRCIDSVLDQTLEDYELIIVDDGSPDGSGHCCDEYAYEDTRVISVHKGNGGVSSARNTGIDFSQSELIAFVDSDDWVEPTYLITYLKPKTDFTISGHNTYDDGDNLMYSAVYEYHKYESRDEIDLWYISDKLFSPYCRLFRRDIITQNNIRFPSDLSWGEDGVFASEYFKYINSMCILPCNTYHYIVHNSSVSLASRLRPDIIETIATSRELYLQNIISVTSNDVQPIIKKITDDIEFNCAYFVSRAFTDTLSLGEKLTLLKRFYNNKYVQGSINNPVNYYGTVRRVIRQSPGLSLFLFYWFRRIDVCKRALRSSYNCLPEWVKTVYRKLKKEKD